MNQFIRPAIVLLELFFLGNAILMAFLLGTWMESDAFAQFSSEADWWTEAGKRFLVASVLSVVVSALVWFVNKPLFGLGGFKNERLPAISAGVTLVSLCTSSLIGAIIFAVTKPYM